MLPRLRNRAVTKLPVQSSLAYFAAALRILQDPDHGDGTPVGAWGNNPINPRFDPQRKAFLETSYDDARYPQKWPSTGARRSSAGARSTRATWTRAPPGAPTLPPAAGNRRSVAGQLPGDRLLGSPRWT
ncbi:hypothetical protein ACFQ1L_33110 [Phytohabitans flavus]|uniref:hypothetical protein n=1 Tax=Phytohabitans flavus TaxID=1076124 RepID=UPI001564B495|nr:hypothetical protein [Phytohabitans flavus]